MYYFFRFIIGRKINDSTPRIIMENILEVQIIQPNAVPEVSGTPKRSRIPATNSGYEPKPLLVKATAKLPATKARSMVLKSMLAVCSNAKIQV